MCCFVLFFFLVVVGYIRSSVATIYNNLYYCWATTTTTIFIYNTINISTKITEGSRIHIFHSKVGSHRKKSLRLVIIMQFSVFFSFFFRQCVYAQDVEQVGRWSDGRERGGGARRKWCVWYCDDRVDYSDWMTTV